MLYVQQLILACKNVGVARTRPALTHDLEIAKLDARGKVGVALPLRAGAVVADVRALHYVGRVPAQLAGTRELGCRRV